MTSSAKPPGTLTTGFRPVVETERWDTLPLYRVVELVRDGEGRLREQGRVWHSDLNHVRRFGRAIAANTASHRVLITDAQGDLIEEVPVASADAREATWDRWGSAELPPAPPRQVRRRRPEKPRAAPPATAPAMGAALPVLPATPEPVAEAPAAAAAVPPREIPRLVAQEGEASAPELYVSPVPDEQATLP